MPEYDYGSLPPCTGSLLCAFSNSFYLGDSWPCYEYGEPYTDYSTWPGVTVANGYDYGDVIAIDFSNMQISSGM